MGMTVRLLVALAFSAALATAALAAPSSAASGGNASSSAHGTHKPGVKPASGATGSSTGKAAVVSPSSGPGVGSIGPTPSAHIKKKANGSQPNSVGTSQPSQGASSVGEAGRNAIAAKITATAGASSAPHLAAPQPSQGASAGGETGRSAIGAKITNANGATQAGQGLGAGGTKNAVMTGKSIGPSGLTPGTVPTPRNAALITGTGMGPKGMAPPSIKPAARNSASINGTGMAGKN